MTAIIMLLIICCLQCYNIQAVIKTNAGRGLCTVESENGNTPLHSSCENGDFEIVKVICMCIM